MVLYIPYCWQYYTRPTPESEVNLWLSKPANNLPCRPKDGWGYSKHTSFSLLPEVVLSPKVFDLSCFAATTGPEKLTRQSRGVKPLPHVKYVTRDSNVSYYEFWRQKPTLIRSPGEPDFYSSTEIPLARVETCVFEKIFRLDSTARLFAIREAQ